ncbi:MAG: MBL fold metallo-hydrolase [Idiomarina sp.]|nr:MBL fold metallo-hydrolase [Idiomarina sp.]
MIVEKVKTEGLAHLSYLVADGDQAIVIDPRRDTRIYERLATEHGCQIIAIFETHRNEDFVTGAPVLAKRTGAQVYHGPHPDQPIEYAKTVEQGFQLQLGRLRIDVMETPGHTYDSVSLVLYDTEADNSQAVGVFTGDALFIGDVGRTDFYPDEAEKVAGLLHDSIASILQLGDHTILYPAHGAGSVCGGGLSDREFSTLGHERLTNPVLKLIGDRDAFIAHKTGEHHYMPPYFSLMEQRNSDGKAPVLQQELPALSYEQFKEKGNKVWVDVRSVEAFSGHYIAGSLALPVSMIAAYAGWLIKPEHEIVLLADSETQAHTAYAHFYRIGFDNVSGYWQINTNRWAVKSGQVSQIEHIGVNTLAGRLRENPDLQILDVRKYDEWKDTGVISGAYTAYLGHLAEKLGGLNSSQPVVVVCGSGQRATVAASLLKVRGFDQVCVLWGGMNAWQEDFSTEPYTE